MQKSLPKRCHNVKTRERESSSRLILSSPSLSTSGAREWVDSTTKPQEKLTTASMANAIFVGISKLDSTLNVKSAKDTHPQTPLVLREGAFEVANSAVCHTAKTNCHTEGVARSISRNISKDSVNNVKSAIYHLRQSEASQKQNRDISLVLNMTKSTNVQNPLDISVSTKPQYGNKISQWAFVLLTRKLAKSLLGIGLASVVCANTAVAICTFVENNASSIRDVRCEDVITSDDLSGKAFLISTTEKTPYRTTNYLIGNANTSSFVAGSFQFMVFFDGGNRHNIKFANVNALSSWFNFTNEGAHPVTLTTEVGAGAVVGGLVLNGTMETLSVFGSGAYLGRIVSGTPRSTIKTLRLGERTTINGVEQGVGNALLGSNNINCIKVVGKDNIRCIKVDRLELDGISLNINSSGETWNTNPNATREQHLSFGANSLTTYNIKPQSIIINIGQDAEKGAKYYYKNLILKDGKGLDILNSSHIAAGQGVKLIKESDHFSLQADVSTSQGSSVYRALALSYMRRTVMTQNILDTMTTKTFHSDRYYEQEAQLKTLRDDMGRLTNRSSRFSKLTRSKNQESIDKVRQKVAKLTLEQSRAQNLKKYNNFELIDQLDAMFIPYNGRRDNRVFVLPYSAHSYADMGSSNAIEWVGGTLVGLQKNLRAAGIIGGYVGYEFVNTSTKLLG